ncbi:RP-L2 [Lepeophtheirus salmonis]|uniref:RP-L2 n=1 Tax=Lepeophtheirus salmonis TaxID=72036 RepID=A0A7R8CRV5_LEPSM|nr:RP-L2 [Lepeophtheirus salmonis]CAF2911034.1 RP-L2 [Lepeophtheirus salmonis]
MKCKIDTRSRRRTKFLEERSRYCPLASMSLGSSLLFRSLLPRSVQFTSLRYTDRKHRIDFKILKDDPNLGPHKKLAPGVKYGGRVGENVEYRGRDPETGRKVVEGIGGGSKQKARWIILTDSLKKKSPSRMRIDAQIALTAYGNSHPIGALPFGTEICCMEFVSGEGMTFIRDAGNSATILRDYDDKRVVIRSPNRMRWMGNRPRSGLWQRKKGIHGRKIRAPPPVKVIRVGKDDEEQKTIRLHAGTEGIRGMPAGRKRHFDINKW